MDGDGHVRRLALHGFASHLPFEMTAADPGGSITMTLRDTPFTRTRYPYAFEFRMTYRLLENGLEATMTVSHEAPVHGMRRPMPFYAGHHFYFELPQQLRRLSTLYLPAARMSRQLPDGTLAPFTPGDRAYSVDDATLMDCYHVLDEPGTVLLAIPPHPRAPTGRRIRVELDGAPDPWYAVTTWTQRQSPADFYCVEPWMGLANAIHHGHGLRLLAPGDSTRATCRLVIESGSQAPCASP